MNLYARLALEAAEYEFDMPYEYKIPEEMQLESGMRVVAPFGQGNRKTCGIVLSVSDTPTAQKHKTIVEALDREPLLDESLIKLALWLHKTVYCSVWHAICAMLPAGLRHARTECLTLCDDAPDVTVPEGDAETLYRALLESKTHSLPRAALTELLQGRTPDSAVKTLLALGLCEMSVVSKRKSGDKTESIVSLAVSSEEARSAEGALRSIRQRDVLRALAENGALSLPELRYLTGAARTTLNRLVELRLIEISEQEVYRRPVFPISARPPILELSDTQQSAVERLCELLEAGTPACALLHGVTGSGKTNVYIAMMRKAVELGGTCLILAPEIALTPQLLERFGAHFGDRIAILHSGLSLGERMDEWKRVRAGLCDVVVGTRSAVFAPLENLRLLILDEEHETTYKSESIPRYHAREVAKFRAVQNGALLVLGSATPSMESMYAAQYGQYTYIELPERYQDRPLPTVTVTDMAKELREGNMGVIGAPLYREIRANLVSGEQTILFLNRRGASKYIVCVDCQTVPECPRCSRNLVYHSVSGRLHCHLCGHSEKCGDCCPHCQGEMKMVGAGTQKVVEELETLFPNTSVLRLDADTTMRKGAAQKILKEFSERNVPILVGTQMVAKGLDFPGVTLVGVINADAALWAADFRAHEKTFALLTQVVGRGGRGVKPGRAILQSYSGAQSTLLDAAAQDYHRFFARELELRRLLQLPPFTFVARLCLFGTKQDDVLKACLRVRGWLENRLRAESGSATILGPAQAAVLKVNLRFRYHITLVSERKETLRNLMTTIMREFPKDRQNRGVHLYADPDTEEG